MAQRLSAFPTGRGANEGGLRDEWLDGGVYRLQQGVDYTTSDDAFRNRISSESARRGILIRTRKVEGGYVIQAFSPGVRGLAESEPARTLEAEQEPVASDSEQAPGRARGRSAAA